MLIPRFWTTYRGVRISLPEITFSDGFVPIYRDALKSEEFAERVRKSSLGMCCAMEDVIGECVAADHFFSRMSIALRGSGFLNAYVREKVGLLGYEQLGKSDMIDLRLAWAAYMVEHMDNDPIIRLNEESPC